jgi:hypothetical protein
MIAKAGGSAPNGGSGRSNRVRYTTECDGRFSTGLMPGNDRPGGQ